MRFLSIDELRSHLTKLSYRPGWRFEVYDGVWEGPHFVVWTEVEDSLNPGSKTTLDVHSMLPPMPSTEYFEVWIAWRLKRLEVHEMREFLQRDGQPIFDPHAPGAEHDDVVAPTSLCSAGLRNLT